MQNFGGGALTTVVCELSADLERVSWLCRAQLVLAGWPSLSFPLPPSLGKLLRSHSVLCRAVTLCWNRVGNTQHFLSLSAALQAEGDGRAAQ